MNSPDPSTLRASRLKLLLIMLVFAAPIVVAMLLTLGGWQPSGKANGQAITPQRNFASEQVPVSLSNGDTWEWRAKEPKLTLVALAGPDCAKSCLDVLTKMAAAHIAQKYGMPKNAKHQPAAQYYYEMFEDVRKQLDIKSGDPVKPEHL